MRVNVLDIFKNKKFILGASFLALALSIGLLKKKRVSKRSRNKQPYIKNLAKLSKLIELPFEPSYKIHISNPSSLSAKLQEMKADGINELNVIADYDLTITSFHINGEENFTAYQILVRNQISSEQFLKSSKALDDFYKPLEKDLSIPMEQKKFLMAEWYQKINDLILSERFTVEQLSKIIEEREIAIRYHFKNYFLEYIQKNVPFYIVSGGISDFVSTVLENFVGFHNYPNTRIFSNSFIFNKRDEMIDLDKVINTTTKKTILRDQKIPYRKNAILLGDLPGDASMSDNIGAKNTIKIAFLHDSSELHGYEPIFDIVIEGEGDWTIPHLITEFIEGKDTFKEKFQGVPAFQEILGLI